MWLFLPLLFLPAIEIALFIQVGGWIGLWPTLGLVVLSAVAGSAVVRRQGAAAMAELRRTLAERRDPTAPIAHGAMILTAGALLLIPGFFSDILGIALLVPPVRGAVIGAARRRIRTAGDGPAARAAAPRARRGFDTGREGEVLDGEYTDVTAPDGQLPPGQSGWTRH